VQGFVPAPGSNVASIYRHDGYDCGHPASQAGRQGFESPHPLFISLGSAVDNGGQSMTSFAFVLSHTQFTTRRRLSISRWRLANGGQVWSRVAYCTCKDSYQLARGSRFDVQGFVQGMGLKKAAKGTYVRARRPDRVVWQSNQHRHSPCRRRPGKPVALWSALGNTAETG